MTPKERKQEQLYREGTARHGQAMYKAGMLLAAQNLFIEAGRHFAKGQDREADAIRAVGRKIEQWAKEWHANGPR